ncbi:spore coat putative kinase YutH [Alteribacter populi]|uniref:spore coat putative kinase YutH n=1 Tax=Alteribacter populi TaxID=2011011 RepID=UPI000BBAC944|nr:spore coat protein YutH [Alteribacter populi]
MLERSLFDHYRLYAEGVMHTFSETIIEANGEQYILTPVQYDQDQLQQQSEMGQWLQSQGEEGIPELVNTEYGKPTVDLDGTVMGLYRLPSSKKVIRASAPLGRKLAAFHQRGQYYSMQSRKKGVLGAQSWKGRWERRLDQMESWYSQLLRERVKTPFDQTFLLTYPYYMALSENAIQLMNDIAIDDGIGSMGQGNTICHRRFNETTWLTVDERHPSSIKVPGQFIIDHFTRDLAEWLREDFRNNFSDYRNMATQFPEIISAYEEERPLTTVDRKLMIARLLFPLHYFEIIETYYQTVDEEKKVSLEKEFLKAIEHSGNYERKVSEVIRYLMDDRSRMRLPVWLE